MKNNYLPLVKPEISWSLEHTLVKHSDQSYIAENLNHILENNPVIYRFLKGFSELSVDPVTTLFSGLIVYKMLESQAEANFLNSDEYIRSENDF